MKNNSKDSKQGIHRRDFVKAASGDPIGNQENNEGVPYSLQKLNLFMKTKKNSFRAQVAIILLCSMLSVSVTSQDNEKNLSNLYGV